MKDIERYGKKFEEIRKNVGKVIVGYEEVIDDFLICLMTGGHLLLEGVPGIAKTTLIKAFTEAVGLGYERIQFTQDLLPADISGHYYYNQKTGEFELRKGPIFAQILMADEINRAPPKTQSALIEAMQEKQVTIEGNTFPLPDPFLVIATRNPIETEGVYPLPEAQLDRFMIKSDMSYLSKGEELDMLKMKNDSSSSNIDKIDGRFGSQIIGLYHNVHVSDPILEYIRDLIIETRNIEELLLGASPRAAEQLLYASKARALLNGRDYVIPDDVKSIVPKVLNHRLILSIDAELEDVNKLDVIDEILQERVEAPKGKFND
ncbi:MAG: AAA family ATPase [Thermoplasmatota archaeon]